MSSLSLLESLIIEQTCRYFACEDPTKNGLSSRNQESTDIYSMDFLRNLHDCPADNIKCIIERGRQQEQNASMNEKEILLDYFIRVADMKSEHAKQWNDLQHFICFTYRLCMLEEPDPDQDTLSEYVAAEMRSLVCSLMKEDQVQLCLRLFSLMREYTIFAHKEHQKIANIELAIENLFYYYEAFLAATKNICKIFPELEKIILNTYKLGWLDLNTSIFMYYFYETNYIQSMVRQFEQMKDSVSMKSAGLYTVLTELHKLWRSQMLGINGVIANKLGAKFEGLDNEMMSAHKKILSKNFWIDRAPKEKGLQDMYLFDCQLFSLVGNKSLILPEATLDDAAQCICEECLICRYKSVVESKPAKFPPGIIKIGCRFCRAQLDVDDFEIHLNCKNLNDEDRKLTRMISHDLIQIELPDVGEVLRSFERTKEPSDTDGEPKCNNDKENRACANLNAKVDKSGENINGKSYCNLLKYQSLTDQGAQCEERSKITEKTHNHNDTTKSSVLRSGVDSLPKPKGNKKDRRLPLPCGHGCKLEEELRTEFKKAYQDTCDHHKETKKCDCTFCEVFGNTASNHKSNETRNRLRIRLNQRNEKVSKVRTPLSKISKIPPPPPPQQVAAAATPPPPPPQNLIPNVIGAKEKDAKPPNIVRVEKKSNNNDIHGLLNYIEGNTAATKAALAEKKAAKKARQRHKKEQERLKIEEEERKKQEEEERKLEERRRSEELAKQLAEKAAKIISKKEAKKKKQKEKALEKKSGLIEETIPAMVTIKRVVENNGSGPTVTITLKGSTPDQDKLLYTLVNGSDDASTSKPAETKKSKKNKNGNNVQETKTIELNATNKKTKNKPDSKEFKSTVGGKELRVTLAVDPASSNTATKSKKKQKNENKQEKKRNEDVHIPMLKLPPGITITKVDGPVTERNYKSVCNDAVPPYNSNIPVSKSGVIVVDTEKLIKQSNVSTVETLTKPGKKNKKKRNKKLESQQAKAAPTKPSMVTLKNPIFQNMQQPIRREPEPIRADLTNHCQQAAIFKTENGMVTIRSSRLQQSLTNGSPMPNLLTDLKPVLGPDVPSTCMSSCSFPETSRISSFNAQEILSGLPGIEITKVDKNASKSDADRKACHTAEVSIIPANNGLDKFNFDKDDLHYENVFSPRDILEEDMDADERELEAFKRFCQQSIPPKRKEKVAHLNVKDIILKKKHDKIPA